MGEIILVIVAMTINVALAFAAGRLVWWLFLKIVGGTGKAWRGD